jgi:hypothetical protein
LRIVDKCIDVFAEPMISMQPQSGAAAQDPFGNSLTLLLEFI